jgi:hypothetical protein
VLSFPEKKVKTTVGGSSMKTPFRIFVSFVLGAIVTFAVINYLSNHIVRDQKLLLYIGTKPLIGSPTYVYWTAEDDFDKALAQVCSNGGTYKIRKLKSEHEQAYDAKSCKELLKTLKVTKSKVADDAATVASAGNDPNTVYKVAATKVEDIRAVVNALSPTPSPTP